MRYAIYFAADAGDRLMQLGNYWLGRDPFSGNDLQQPDVAGLSPARVHALSSDPRRYGFHGTLKAPFSLRAEQSEAALVAACESFAADLSPFEIDGLGVSRLGRFLALTPTREEPGLRAFASACVRRFEPFRAPLADADLERRRRSGLTAAQDSHLANWGYPYIFDEFRFHMTLSNKLEDDREAGLLADAAKAWFAGVTDQPRICSHFALYSEAERNAPFKVHTVFQLSGRSSPEEAAARREDPTLEENA